jgi:hypothetical protein
MNLSEIYPDYLVMPVQGRPGVFNVMPKVGDAPPLTMQAYRRPDGEIRWGRVVGTPEERERKLASLRAVAPPSDLRAAITAKREARPDLRAALAVKEVGAPSSTLRTAKTTVAPVADLRAAINASREAPNSRADRLRAALRAGIVAVACKCKLKS